MPKKILSQKEKLMEKNREKITIVLDSDIIEFFKARANQPDSPKYQAQINNELRRIVDANKQSNKNDLSPAERAFLENEFFIKALKEKMESI